jgi:glycosyltransferase involved in cell wall biosynthesis
MTKKQISVMFPVNILGVGGAEQQLLELVKGVDKERFEITVVSLYPGGLLEPEVKVLPGVELICLNRKEPYDFSILLDMYHLLRQKRVQIIQPFLTPATFFGLLPALTNRSTVKIITERCGVRVNHHIGAVLYRKVEDFFTRFADWVIPNSLAGESYLIRRGIDPARIKVIYNGINLRRLTPDPDAVARIRQVLKIPPNGQVVGITASLTPAKDHVTFLQAAQLISQALPQTKFAILGDGPLKADLEETAKKIGVDSVVTFFGNQRDIGSYISVYDVACLASMDHEGCSNATLEAMALGKPVVITDIGGNKELVEHGKTGFLIPPKNPKVLAETIINCLKQPDRARQIGDQARQKILTHFSLESMVHNYEALYENAIQQKEKKAKWQALPNCPG